VCTSRSGTKVVSVPEVGKEGEENMMDFDGMLNAIADPRIVEGLRRNIVEQLKDMPLSEIGATLALLEKAGPVFIKAVTKAVGTLRRMPIDQLAALLHSGSADLVAKPKAAAKTPPKAEPKTRKPMVMSAARKAGLKLQGQYMGYLRAVSPVVKAQAKKIKAASGYKAALDFLAKAKAGKLPVKAPAKKLVPLHLLAKTKEYAKAKKVAMRQNPVKKVQPKSKKG
jgi:hypothetical protein